MLASFSKADIGVQFYDVGQSAGTMAVIYCIVNSFVVMFLLGRFWVLSKSKWHKHLGSESEWASNTQSAKSSGRGQKVRAQLDNESLITTETGTMMSKIDGEMRPPAYLILDTEIFYQFCDKRDQGKLLEQNATANQAPAYQEVPEFGSEGATGQGKPVVEQEPSADFEEVDVRN